MPIRTTIQRHRVQWILNALSHVQPESLASKGMISWIATKVDLFGITLPKGFTVHEKPRQKKGKQEEIDQLLGKDEALDNQPLREKRIKRYQDIKRVFERAIKEAAKNDDLKTSDAEQNLSLLAQRINLTPEDENILLFYTDFRGLSVDKLLPYMRTEYDSQSYFMAVSKFLNMPPEKLRQKLSTKSVLRNFISFHPEGTGYDYDKRRRIDVVFDSAYFTDEGFIKVISEPASSADAIIARLLGPTPTTELTLDDFAYLGADKLAYFVETLRGAVEGNGKPRKNNSLYGKPGVGKTELTAVIAKHLGVSLYAIGLSHLDDENVLSDNINEPTRADRLLAWRRAAYLAKAANMKCIFLIDEADDILRDPDEDKNSNRASKAYLNWLLDNNNVPTVFITNNIHIFEESTIRRILPTLHIPSAPHFVQSKILQAYARNYGIPITEEQASSLTLEHNKLTSGVIETIVYKTSRRKDISNNPQAQFRALSIGFSEAAAALNNGSRPVPEISRSTKDFDPRLNASQLDIPSLANDFSQAKSLAGLRICLYGSQGAGKRTLLHYLAEKMGLKTKFLDYNSLYGSQGFSTAALKDELETALRGRSMIVFNNLARLLQNPEWSALDSHPFFLGIDAHPLPIGATVHDCDEIDIELKQFFRLTGQFTFSSRVASLDREGQRIALEKVVGLSPDDADKVAHRISDVIPLVVGDFVRVANQMRFQPSLAGQPEAVFQALQHNAMQAGHPSLHSPAAF